MLCRFSAVLTVVYDSLDGVCDYILGSDAVKIFTTFSDSWRRFNKIN
jgi:hypothetical protein